MDTPQIIAGRFRIECEIGRGGMGTVYRASHLGLERPVAVKVLKQEFAAYPEVAERFMREARTMARLKHPRAAMIFDAGHLADGRPFIVMEYVEGSTLAETLAREGTLAPEKAVQIAAEICDVLSEAHALGIVHRDLKPSNIMLNGRGVCVLDFGIAKVLQNSTEVTRTHPTTESGLVIGTPRYMSPEQCLGHAVGPASDLYSVGVLLYEMLAGRPPFLDTLSSAVLVKVATATPPPLLALRPELPRPLALAVHTLLAKNPALRPAKAAEARALLERSVAVEPRPAEYGERAEPFASTIGALDAGRYAFTRVATMAAILAMLATALLMWTGNGAGQANAHESLAGGAAVLAAPARGARARAAAQPPPLTPEEARRIAANVTRGRIGDARLVQTGDGQAIAAVHDDPSDGMTHLFVLERRRGATAFRVMNGQNINLAMGSPRFAVLRERARLMSFEELAGRARGALRTEAVSEWSYRNGLNSLWLGNYESALGYFESAVNKNPNRVEAWIQVGFCKVKQGKTQEAIKAFQQALRLRPNSYEAHNKLGDAYYYAGSYYQAVESYKRAVSLRPDLPEGYYNLGIAYHEIGDRAAAGAQVTALKGLDAELHKKLVNEIER